MSKALRYFVKLDSKNVPVAASNINRPKRPKSGKWQEISSAVKVCCGPELRYTPSFPVTNIVLVLLCDAVAKITSSSTEDATTITELVNFLSAEFPYLGAFSADGAEVVFQVSQDVKESICPDGTLTFTVT